MKNLTLWPRKRVFARSFSGKNPQPAFSWPVMRMPRSGLPCFIPPFSTLLGKRGLHLDDLYVKPRWRGLGIGKALLSRMAELAVQKGCSRFEWWCLDWNTDALEFYEKLGAKPVEDVLILRMTGKVLQETAKKAVSFQAGDPTP